MSSIIAVSRLVQEQVLPLLAPSLRSILEQVPHSILDQVEEIRLRQDRPLQLCLTAGDMFLSASGSCTTEIGQAYRLTEQERVQTLLLLSRSSFYAIEEELRRGYLTLPGGHRVGLAGRAILTPSGDVQTLKDITCMNIRIARQVIGAADPIKKYMVDTETKQVYNTLILSPPQCGKTTLLRDLTRQISDGQLDSRLPPRKVGLVDERSEIAGCVNGIAQHDVGLRVDILDACPKAAGMLMMIRSMSPQVLVVDEIGRTEDTQAVLEAIHAGVQVIVSAHGASMEDVLNRPVLRELFNIGAFDRYLILSRRRGPVTLEAVFDRFGGSIFQVDRGRT